MLPISLDILDRSLLLHSLRTVTTWPLLQVSTRFLIYILMILILTFRHTGDLINKFFTILHSKCALIINKVNNRDYRFIEKGFYKLNCNC